MKLVSLLLPCNSAPKQRCRRTATCQGTLWLTVKPPPASRWKFPRSPPSIHHGSFNLQLRDSLYHAMSGVRKGSRLVKTLGQGQFSLRKTPSCVRSLASAAEANPRQNDHLSDLESTTTFTSPAPDQKSIDAFNQAEKLSAKERRLPGNRYVSALPTTICFPHETDKVN